MTFGGAVTAGQRVVWRGATGVLLGLDEGASPTAGDHVVPGLRVAETTSAAGLAVAEVQLPYVSSAAPTPSPPVLSGLIWFNHADLGRTLVSSRVSSWADQSGAGNTTAQATAGRRPDVFALPSGKEAIRFLGSRNDELARASLAAPLAAVDGNLTLAMAYQVIPIVDSTPLARIGALDAGARLIGASTTETVGWSYLDEGSGPGEGVQTIAPATATPTVSVLRRSGVGGVDGLVRLRHAGLDYSGPLGVVDDLASTSPAIAVGAGATTGTTLLLRAVLAYSRALTDAETDALDLWLQNQL
jgi:hypothetical protein